MVYETPIVGYDTDPMNFNHARHLRNTPKRFYNCGGFALGTFSWYCPYERGFDPLEDGFETDLENYLITRICVSTMLREFADLRQLWELRFASLKEIEANLVEQLEEDEYLIAFRISDDGDFHYAKKASNGVWYHKMGARERIERTTFAEINEDYWLDRYNGIVCYFAKKKTK
jgi:hypothetical protein